jgi:hypothetical protein
MEIMYYLVFLLLFISGIALDLGIYKTTFLPLLLDL